MTIERKMIREILLLAYPVIIGMISHTVLNLVDTAMVGRLGDVSLGSVGLGSFFILVTVLIFGSFHVGMQAITARRVGEKRPEEFERILLNGSLLALIVGVAVSAAGYALSSPIFSLLSDDPEIVRVGTDYLGIRALSLFSMVMIFTLRGFVYGLARVRIDMIVSILINLLNVVLNYFLIFGHWIFPRLEVRGAAIASAVSTVIGLAVYIGFVYFRVHRHLPDGGRRAILSRSLMWQITRISAPRALQSASIFGFLIFLRFVGEIGVGELAISNIIFKVFNLSFMVGMSVGTASATLVGRSLGEGDGKLAERYGWHSVGLGAFVMGLIGALFIFFPREIMGIFTSSAETIEIGVMPFRLLGAFQLIDGVGIVLSRILQGTGNTFYVMISEMLTVWIVFIPFTFAAVRLLDGGLELTWWGLYLYVTVFAAAMFVKFLRGSWKHVKI
jgi:MATE family multidrug resistance protein